MRQLADRIRDRIDQDEVDALDEPAAEPADVLHLRDLPGGQSEVLDLGRTKRTVSVAQRKALHTRDRGCAFPGCSRPLKWCDAHHVKHRADGGDTDLTNLVLLCRTHHSLVHHSRWSITMTGGVPAFIPPRHVDPAQLPRQNLLHRPPMAIAA